jgi:uncharacterized MAPEG superfamily protein
MSADLVYLALSAALCALLWVPYVLARFSAWGIADTVGYPESPPALPGWAQRAQRAHVNMVANLIPFAALVLAAHAAGAATALTALGAGLFFWGRLVHAVVYIAKVPWARTLAFVVAWVGIVVIFVDLVF